MLHVRHCSCASLFGVAPSKIPVSVSIAKMGAPLRCTGDLPASHPLGAILFVDGGGYVMGGGWESGARTRRGLTAGSCRMGRPEVGPPSRRLSLWQQADRPSTRPTGGSAVSTRSLSIAPPPCFSRSKPSPQLTSRHRRGCDVNWTASRSRLHQTTKRQYRERAVGKWRRQPSPAADRIVRGSTTFHRGVGVNSTQTRPHRRQPRCHRHVGVFLAAERHVSGAADLPPAGAGIPSGVVADVKGTASPISSLPTT